MRIPFSYENIIKYDLTSFVLDEYKKEYFTYIVFLLDTSIPILDSEKPYVNCIKEVFKWNMLKENKLSSKTILYENILKMMKTMEKFNYELFIVYASPYTEDGNPKLAYVTDEMCEIVNTCYKPMKDSLDGLHLNDFPSFS